MEREVIIYNCGCVYATAHREGNTLYSGYCLEQCSEHFHDGDSPHREDPHTVEVWEV